MTCLFVCLCASHMNERAGFVCTNIPATHYYKRFACRNSTSKNGHSSKISSSMANTISKKKNLWLRSFWSVSPKFANSFPFVRVLVFGELREWIEKFSYSFVYACLYVSVCRVCLTCVGVLYLFVLCDCSFSTMTMCWTTAAWPFMSIRFSETKSMGVTTACTRSLWVDVMCRVLVSLLFFGYWSMRILLLSLVLVVVFVSDTSTCMSTLDNTCRPSNWTTRAKSPNSLSTNWRPKRSTLTPP